jgi:hypothetical protein
MPEDENAGAADKMRRDCGGAVGLPIATIPGGCQK